MRWSGKVADFLQIKGRRVTKYELTQASAGYCPLSSQPLYQRQSTNRRLGWDILFMPPKSISVAALVGTGGDRIVRAHSQAVETAFTVLAEPAAAVSARSHLGLHNWRTTGAMLFTHVVHRTNREKEPHLHSHLLVMNTTLDAGRRLMGLETGPVFERFGAMEKIYNHSWPGTYAVKGLPAASPFLEIPSSLNSKSLWRSSRRFQRPTLESLDMLR